MKKKLKDSTNFQCWKMTLKIRIFRCSRRLFTILVSLTVTLFGEKIIIFTRCIGFFLTLRHSINYLLRLNNDNRSGYYEIIIKSDALVVSCPTQTKNLWRYLNVYAWGRSIHLKCIKWQFTKYPPHFSTENKPIFHFSGLL